ncbi:(3R)-3-hydroxyacyl-CoA dehydrogenase [Phyllostomus hastatus]|uniref:(3R)-3-hydroxyacyl-CoA dehydrogenase n=1 Tax=Phyllostomus hastatus TaxID=9423 RepID=UPI001E684F95|nr:(3R)-3-hydroxyacyl-CoA dehydrogenase [Phyllostomus hastatus]
MQPLSFLWGDEGPSILPFLRAPSVGVWPHLRGGRSAGAGGLGYVTLTGLQLAWLCYRHAPTVPGLALCWITRSSTASHGDSAPAPLCSSPGHRLRGCTFREGSGTRMLSGVCPWPVQPLGLLAAGAGSGIRRAVSVRLAQEGAAVAACDLDGAAARETVQLLGGPGSEKRAHAAFQTDVSEAGSARHLLEQVQACFTRPPSVVVSCAGITRDEFRLHMSEDDWDKVIAVNLKGIFLVTQAAAQALVSSGCHGSIINISSIIGKVGNMGQTNYSVSKAGVIGLTQTVAQELGRYGIRCNAVLPLQHL